LKLQETTKLDTITNEGLTWINIERPTRNTMENLLSNKGFHFHELDIDDCLSKIQIPKIDKHNEYIFVVLHFPSSPIHAVINSAKKKARKTSTTTLHFSQLSVFAGWNFLVTIHQGDLQPLNDLFQQCKQGNINQKEEIMGKTSGYLLHTIIDVLVDDLFHMLMKIVGNLEDIEDAVFDDKVEVVKEISLLRREITILRRIVYPLKRIVSDITRDIQRFSEENLTDYFNDVEDHINKVLEVLETSRETIDIYKDTDFMLNTEKTNQILAILTIVFSLSIPATIIGTFYGMNISLPGGLETGPWVFLGTYTTLIIMLILSAAAALLMYWSFRRVGWVTSSRRRISN
jgi:magnesium transporter